jgi:hypothetical protein
MPSIKELHTYCVFLQPVDVGPSDLPAPRLVATFRTVDEGTARIAAQDFVSSLQGNFVILNILEALPAAAR